MKLSAAQIAPFLKAPNPAMPVILVYGPDGGLVRERVAIVAKSVLADLSDPFRVADLSASTIKDDPARLLDEALALSLIGGRRVVIVRDAGDALTQAVKSLLEAPVLEALVVIEGGDLGSRSTLRLLCEKADNAASLPCYADDQSSLSGVISEMIRSHHLSIAPDALAFLVGHLGADRALTRSEIDKLITYKGKDKSPIDLEDVKACIGDGAALGQDDLILAVADGDLATVLRILDRLAQEGESQIGILRAAVRHFQKLHLVSGAIAQGKSQDQALALIKPPLFFKVADRFKRQLRQWPTARLALALETLTEAEIQCKTTGLPAQAILERTFLQIARFAARAKAT